MAPHVLIADDDRGVVAGLSAICRAGGHSTCEAFSGERALEVTRGEHPDLVLLDVHLPDGNGLDVLPRMLELDPAPQVVVMTGLADVPTAVRAMKSGACDFLEKPIRKEILEGVIARVLEMRGLRRERDRLRNELVTLKSGPVIGRSGEIRHLVEHVDRVASTPKTTVLILGESGAGKELVARAVHERSARGEGPFVALNCASLSESMLEAELFGYEPGSFTGASSRGHEGLFATAEGGSLFLDEIGELEPTLQARLLRVLQERVYRRLGGNSDRKVDVRVLASTNRDLEEMVEDGRFREDLYYRLNVMVLRVPALRDRREDIPLLCDHFLAHFAAEFGRDTPSLTQEALEKLVLHPWPGNVRELRNVIERTVLLHPGDSIDGDDVSLDRDPLTLEPAPRREDGIVLPTRDCSLRAMERLLIERVMELAGGNRSQAARMLGVNRTTLYNKLKAYEA